MTTQTPLPCPFCAHVGVNIHHGATYRWVVAGCDDCGAQTGEVRKVSMAAEITEQDKVAAIQEWNTRRETKEITT